jgi:hypothetical protein
VDEVTITRPAAKRATPAATGHSTDADHSTALIGGGAAVAAGAGLLVVRERARRIRGAQGA